MPSTVRPGCLFTRGALLVALAAVLAALASGARAQTATGSAPGVRLAQVLVVPQQRVYRLSGPTSPVRMTAVDVLVVIDEQVATTTMRVKLANDGPFDTEAQLMIPVPDGAVVRSFDFEGQAPQTTARLLPRDVAASVYHGIVNQVRDPALLEFSSRGAIESSVFPVPAHGGQSVAVVWEQVLEADGARVEYELPRSETAGPGSVPWHVAVRLGGSVPVPTVYSPTHRAQVTRLARTEVLVQLSEEAAREPGSFRLTWLRGAGQLAAGVMACPDGDGLGGWFLLLAGAPDLEPGEGLPRAVTVVLDRSGSMRGRKFDQAVEAVKQIVTSLAEGECFNVLDYSDSVGRFAVAPVPKTPDSERSALAYLDSLEVGGGTNLHQALLTAVQQDVRPDMLPVVLFLTDGLPTVGVTDEKRIAEEIAGSNRHARRLFTFGVGEDVNAPLLDRLSDDSRGSSTYVRPDEDVESAVGAVAKHLHGPVMAEPVLVVRDAAGVETTLAVREVQPTLLPDVYASEQLTLLGRYTTDAPVTLTLTGRGQAGEVSIGATLDPALASARHVYVPRLWAGRRIASLVDEVRRSGATPGGHLPDARLSELVQEIVALSTQFGVLSEYTAFLATEGATLWDPKVTHQRLRKLLASRAQDVRTGRGAVSQARNLRSLRQRGQVDRLNAYLDANMHTVEIGRLQHVDDLAFFRDGERWIDSRIIARVQGHDPADRTPPFAGKLRAVTFGTPAYDALAAELAAEGRPAVLALDGDVLLLRGEDRVLVRAPKPEAPAATTTPPLAPPSAQEPAPPSPSDP